MLEMSGNEIETFIIIRSSIREDLFFDWYKILMTFFKVKTIKLSFHKYNKNIREVKRVIPVWKIIPFIFEEIERKQPQALFQPGRKQKGFSTGLE